MDKLSYAWGLAMGKQLQAMGVKEVNSESFKDGVKVAFDGGEPEISVEEAQKLINDYLEDLAKKAEAAARAEEEGEDGQHGQGHFYPEFHGEISRR